MVGEATGIDHHRVDTFRPDLGSWRRRTIAAFTVSANPITGL
jgi:hypothetical protein